MKEEEKQVKTRIRTTRFEEWGTSISWLRLPLSDSSLVVIKL